MIYNCRLIDIRENTIVESDEEFDISIPEIIRYRHRSFVLRQDSLPSIFENGKNKLIYDEATVHWITKG